jgi:hypothetical protein
MFLRRLRRGTPYLFSLLSEFNAGLQRKRWGLHCGPAAPTAYFQRQNWDSPSCVLGLGGRHTRGLSPVFMKANSTIKLKKYKIIKKRKERNRNTHEESRWCNYQQTTYSAATASRQQCLAVWNSMEIRYTRPFFWALFCFGDIQNAFVITALLIR